MGFTVREDMGDIEKKKKKKPVPPPVDNSQYDDSKYWTKDKEKK